MTMEKILKLNLNKVRNGNLRQPNSSEYSGQSACPSQVDSFLTQSRPDKQANSFSGHSVEKDKMGNVLIHRFNPGTTLEGGQESDIALLFEETD